jgi:hypothetical protein
MVVSLSLSKVRKVFKIKGLHPYFDAGLWLKWKSPAFAGLSFVSLI